MFGVFSITSSWRPSAAIVIDEEGGLLRNTPASYYNHDEQMMFTEQLRLLASSGVPYDTWLADDFIRKPELAEKYRVIVFAGMYSIDESRRKLIKRLKTAAERLCSCPVRGYREATTPPDSNSSISVRHDGNASWLSLFA